MLESEKDMIPGATSLLSGGSYRRIMFAIHAKGPVYSRQYFKRWKNALRIKAGQTNAVDALVWANAAFTSGNANDDSHIYHLRTASS
jgi:hypothetical protein